MYIKINSEVNLKSGLAIPSGSVVVIAEGYAEVARQQDGLIPSQVATLLFANEQAVVAGKSPVQGIADFNPVFQNLKLSVADYATKPAQTLLVDAVYNALAAVYGASNIEVIQNTQAQEEAPVEPETV